MSTTFISIIVVFLLLIAYVVVNLFRQSLNDFLEKTIKDTLWIWLPFHALGRLTKELIEKRKK